MKSSREMGESTGSGSHLWRFVECVELLSSFSAGRRRRDGQHDGVGTFRSQTCPQLVARRSTFVAGRSGLYHDYAQSVSGVLH